MPKPSTFSCVNTGHFGIARVVAALKPAHTFLSSPYEYAIRAPFTGQQVSNFANCYLCDRFPCFSELFIAVAVRHQTG